jgi:hypothetical protein
MIPPRLGGCFTPVIAQRGVGWVSERCCGALEFERGSGVQINHPYGPGPSAKHIKLMVLHEEWIYDPKSVYSVYYANDRWE